MKTLKQASVRIFIVATLFSSTAALAQDSELASEVAQPQTEAIVQVNSMSDLFVQDLRQQLSHHIKHQVSAALIHSVESVKHSLR